MKSQARAAALTALILALAVTALATLLAGQALYSYESSALSAIQQDDDFPVATFDAQEPSDPKNKALREKRGKRFDKWGIVSERSQKGLTITSEIEYPALPVIDSDVVVTGEVTGARAHLSNDKSGVYSEFVARMNEVFKQSDQAPVKPGDEITLERAGGRVMFPSGEVGKFKVDGRGMPRQGRRYLLFLKRNAELESFTILMAYELREDKVYPIDGANASVSKNKRWPSDAYKGADVSRLMSDLQKELANPSQRPVVF